MREIALHILDIAENSIRAGANQVNIQIIEDLVNDQLNIKIGDNGRGMDAETVAKITDPFVTSRTNRKVGLGIPFFKAAAEACDGSFIIESKPGIGTEVSATFKHSHIDRMPLGDVTSTFLALLIGAPDIHWVFKHKVNGNIFIFDDQPIKETLDGIPLTQPAVLKYIREAFLEGKSKLYDRKQTIFDSITIQ